MIKTWTPEMVDYLRGAARRKHISTAEIAVEISAKFGVKITRNSVIGQAHRKKIRIGRHGGVRAPRKPRPKPEPVAAPAAPVTSPPAPFELVTPEPAPIGQLTIYDLRGGVCHYPLGSGNPPYLYCGEAADDGSYCPFHRALCYTRARVS